MSISRHVIRDGRYVLEDSELKDVLKSKTPKPAEQPVSPQKAPVCGLLTRTVVHSELAHFILPARLRSASHNDVAFVGDHFLHIRELRPDGQLVDVLRRDDFGCRIRKAVVLGSIPDIKQEEKDGDMVMEGNDYLPRAPNPSLPPQTLVLLLENGDTVCLNLQRSKDGHWHMDRTSIASPLPSGPTPDFHLAVDPGSRYLAVGGAHKSFVVYELGPHESLPTASQKAVVSYRVRSVQGVIHKMEFLYPRPGDDCHVILLVIVIKSGKSRMAVYEWERGDSLKDVFADEKKGYPLSEAHKMPLMLIPLTVCSAFISVSETEVAVCIDLLHGSPNFESVTIEEGRPPTDNFHGRNEPLWVAWARPYRLREFFTSHDCIYLAREDGVVFFIEADHDNTVTGSLYIDKLDCNISTAFCCLYDQYSDVLVMGSESSPGAIWKVPARRSPVRLGTLPNTAPVVDFTTTDEFSTWNQETGASGTRMTPWSKGKLVKPDRIFATSGKGTKGAVTEYRYGFQAKIQSECECGLGVKQAFLVPDLAVFFADPSSSSWRYHVLLSLPDRTRALSLSDTLGELAELEGDGVAVPYDLSSRTIAAVMGGVAEDVVVQVTARHVVLSNGVKVSRLSADKFGGLGPVSILDAAVSRQYIAVSAYTGTQFRVHVLSIVDLHSLYVTVVRSYDIDGDVTCLSLCFVEHKEAMELQVGVRHEGRNFLRRAWIAEDARDSEDRPDRALDTLDPAALLGPDAPAPMDPMESIASFYRNGAQYTVMGFRSGEILTLATNTDGEQSMHAERLNTTAARAIRASEPGQAPMLLVANDSELTLMTDFQPQGGGGKATAKHRVWPLDVAKVNLPCPPVDSVTVVPRSVSLSDDPIISLLLISGSTLLFANVDLKPGPAHRHIPLGGTPDRIIYSHRFKCLIVAMRKATRPWVPTLAFIDPDTGEDMGMPSDNKGGRSEFARGLGKPDDRVMSLAEWEYKKDDKKDDDHVWHFLIMGMNKGRLMIMSVEKEKEPAPGKQGRVRYWTRFQRKNLENPVYSVLGHGDKLIYCVGSILKVEVVDTAEKRLRDVDRYELPSPATALTISNGNIVALCTKDGVQIVESKPATGDGDNSEGARLLHSDPVKRSASHMIEVAARAGDEPSSGLMLVSDHDCAVGGLWTPWQAPGRDCEPIFQAFNLRGSIRRFARGRTRPLWEQGPARKPQYGRIPMTVDDAEILGVYLDGTLVQFQLVNEQTWRLMRYIVNLALVDRATNPLFRVTEENVLHFEPGPNVSVGAMHLDGDVLQRCVDCKALERLMTLRSRLARFKELLNELDDGKLTDQIDSKTDEDENAGYFALAYRILRYYLAQAII